MRAAAAAAVLCLFALLAGGCPRQEADAEVPVVPGAVFRRDLKAEVQLLDVDLATASVRPVVVAENIERRRGNFIGDSRTVRDWAERRGAVGGLNGGFFGDTYDDVGKRKQIVGLAVVEGRTITPGGAVSSTARPGERFLRAAIGFTESGIPDIAWASAAPGRDTLRYPEPINPGRGRPWRVHSAVACGPRLFVRGSRRITNREERLMSPGRLIRAFAAYDLVDGKPRHFVLGRADAMEFEDVADYLETYYRQTHGTTPHDALCLDGGQSGQIVYRDNNILRDAEPTRVLVPTAILLVPKK